MDASPTRDNGDDKGKTHMATATEGVNSSGLNDVTKESSTDLKSASSNEELSGDNGDGKGKTPMATATEGGNSSGLNDVTKDSSTDPRSASGEEESYSNDHDDEKCALARSLKPEELSGDNGDDKGKTPMATATEGGNSSGLDDVTEESSTDLKSASSKGESYSNDHDDEMCALAGSLKPEELSGHRSARLKRCKQALLGEVNGKTVLEFLLNRKRIAYDGIVDDHDHQKCILTWTTDKPTQRLDKHRKAVDPLEEFGRLQRHIQVHLRCDEQRLGMGKFFKVYFRRLTFDFVITAELLF